MRAVVTLVLLPLLLLSACASTGLHAPPEVEEYLAGLTGSIERHRWSEVAAHFDPGYLARQRDELLGGRTGQFLVEALGLPPACPGYAGDELRAFACLDRVCGAEAVAFELTGAPADHLGRVRLRILPTCRSEVPVDAVLQLLDREGGPLRFALEGPVG